MKNLIKTIQNTIYQRGIFERGAKIVVGVSGGPDSVCLLDVLSKLAPKYDLELIIAHVNYGLRGRDSDKDEAYVEKLAEKYGSQFSLLMPVIKDRNISENALRDMRYDFFEAVRKENDFNWIAVAHNADDQVETFLMRVIRGAGLQGLAAMKYKNGKIIRPLLATTRKEILEYLKKNNLTYRTDKTNKANKYLRNKLRNKLIPEVEKKYNPNFRQTVFQAVTSIAEDYDFMNAVLEKEAKKFKDLKVSQLLKLHPALQRRVILSHVEQVKGNAQNIESRHIDEIIKIIKSTKSKNQSMLVQGLKIVRKGDRMDIRLNQ